MIFDGYWEQELNRYAHKLKLWCVLCKGQNTYAEHQVNKYILYSAITIRKLIENKNDVKNQTADLPKIISQQSIIDYNIPTIEYKFNGDEKLISHSVFADDYKDGNREVDLNAKLICNYIIHSYILDLAYEYGNKNKGILGFLTASDKIKDKNLYFVKMSDWIDYINHCKKNMY